MNVNVKTKLNVIFQFTRNFERITNEINVDYKKFMFHVQ